MITINLTETVQFTVKPSEKKIRLTVLKNGEDWVCRTERSATLERFLKDESGRLFKGRLKLIFQDKNVAIEVKGTRVSVIPIECFRQLLANHKPKIS